MNPKLPVLLNDCQISLKGIENFPPAMKFENWKQMGTMLFSLNQFLPWAIGDWLNFGENKWGEKYSEALTNTGLGYSTLAQYAHLAKIFPYENRHENLSWTHHRTVGSLPMPAAERLLSAAAPASGDDMPRMTSRELEDEVRQIKYGVRKRPSYDDLYGYTGLTASEAGSAFWEFLKAMEDIVSTYSLTNEKELALLEAEIRNWRKSAKELIHTKQGG